MVFEVLSVKLTGARIDPEFATNAIAEWLTVSDNGALCLLDVRLMLKTNDDAFIYVEITGRVYITASVKAVAPTFQTGVPQCS